MKKALGIILSAALAAMLMLCAACAGGGGAELPTAAQWAAAGITGEFTAEVSGTLDSSRKSGGEVYLKWTDSGEGSLDSTVSWLVEQGFTKYEGLAAATEDLQGGELKYFIAQKTVTIEGSEAERQMTAEAIYVVQNTSFGGNSLSAGELYLSVFEEKSSQKVFDSWPMVELRAIIGDNIPSYSGSATGYSLLRLFDDTKPYISVTALGGTEADVDTYIAACIAGGYEYSEADSAYVNAINSTKTVQIMVSYDEATFNPDTMETVAGVEIKVYIIKTKGDQTKWSALDLSFYANAGVPEFTAASSYDIDDAGDGLRLPMAMLIELGISLLESKDTLTEQEELQLAQYRSLRVSVEGIETHVVTLYGATAGDIEEYAQALLTAGFTADGESYVKQYTQTGKDYILGLSLDEIDGRLMLVMSRLPIELYGGN